MGSYGAKTPDVRIRGQLTDAGGLAALAAIFLASRRDTYTLYTYVLGFKPRDGI